MLAKIVSKEKPGLHLLKDLVFFASRLCIPLAFADSEHLGATDWADTLGSRFAVLHLYGLGVAQFPLLAALHTIGLHLGLPPFF